MLRNVQRAALLRETVGVVDSPNMVALSLFFNREAQPVQANRVLNLLRSNYGRVAMQNLPILLATLACFALAMSTSNS